MPAGEIAFVPDRLNGRPVVFAGLTDAEIRVVAGANLAAWLPLGTVVGVAAGVWALGVAGGVVLTVAGVWIAGRRLRAVKRGRPDGYHVDRARAWLEDAGLARRTMVRGSRTWDVRRSPGGRRR